MTTFQLVKRNLAFYWRTNLAVVLGVATAVAVLAGALLVGDSVRASLKNLFLQRLGNTTYVVTGTSFFREQLASDIQAQKEFAQAGLAEACPLIALEGTVTHENSKRRGSGIRVYGVDDRFWRFHRRDVASPNGREVFLSENLAHELGAASGDAVLLRVEKLSEIPIESLHSRKEDLGSTLRLSVRQILDARALGEFSIQPQQTGVRAVFVSLSALQKALDQEGNSNLILLSGDSVGSVRDTTTALNRMLKDSASLQDYSIKLRVLNDRQVLSVESEAGFVSDNLEKSIIAAANEAKGAALPYLSYLVNDIRSEHGREIPYSVVTGITWEMFEVIQHNPFGHISGCSETEPGETGAAKWPPIILSQWAGSDLQAKVGDRITLDYYVWLDEGKLATRSTEFRLSCVIPMNGITVDPNLVPDYPGITESENLSDWDPPFPIDLKRIRSQDEAYWREYRTAPKALLMLHDGQSLWGSRFGKLTSLRVEPDRETTLEKMRVDFERNLHEKLDPLETGFSIQPVRAQGLEASRGATDFGEYFLYFSFFLVVSALLLTALFFKLGVEQRVREIGVLQAMGFRAAHVRKIFLTEGIILAVVGSAIGLAGALAYGQLIMVGLRTWWVDAVGTTQLALHVSPISLVVGALGGIIAALICILLTLRKLGKQSARSLLAGQLEASPSDQKAAGGTSKLRRLNLRLLIGILISALGIVLLVAAAFKLIGETAGFFGGGVLLLVGLLVCQSSWLRRTETPALHGKGWWPLSRLGFRNASYRPGRSVLCIALIASAAFIIVAVDAFRHREGVAALDRKSGGGGFSLLAESLLPIVHDPSTEAGKEALNLATDSDSPLANVSFERFRVRPGDDASCLNLYQPHNPKIIAPRDSFLQSNRFVFSNSLATTDEEKTNPWLLLHKPFSDGAIPFIADANSTTYVLHVGLGKDVVLPGGEHLRLVGTLANSVLQSELIVSEANFLRLFPNEEGYRLFLIETPTPERSPAIASALEERLSDFGFDVVPTAERLANFHRVENTYLSTFQMLGGLGLLLGTLGMAAVLLRNVLERRRELALLRAVGYNASHLALMVIAENILLLTSGLVIGVVCALLAIAPVFFERGGRMPSVSLGFLLLAVLLSGLTASIIATWATLRSPLLPALRAE